MSIQFGEAVQRRCKAKENISPLEILRKRSGIDFNLCPICRIGHLS